MRNEAKGEKELRIPLRCRAANVHHAISGEWGPVCVPLAPRATVLDTLRPTHTNRNVLAADTLHGGGPNLQPQFPHDIGESY